MACFLWNLKLLLVLSNGINLLPAETERQSTYLTLAVTMCSDGCPHTQTM